MMVLVCLIFSVLSTIDRYMSFANQTLFWMVRLDHSEVEAVVRSPTNMAAAKIAAVDFNKMTSK